MKVLYTEDKHTPIVIPANNETTIIFFSKEEADAFEPRAVTGDATPSSETRGLTDEERDLRSWMRSRHGHD